MSLRRIVRRIQFAWIGLNEKYLNIATNDRVKQDELPGWRGPRTDRAVNQDNRAYATPDYFYVYKVAKLLRPSEKDVVYDVGCGMGRFLCVMSRGPVRKCVGIELLDDLCTAAEANARSVRGRRCPIDIRNEDACRADLSDGTIYFFFNPFGPDTFREVLANLERSLLKNPRRLKIAYYNSVCRDVVDSCSWLRRTNTFRTFNGHNVDFYESV
jgi:hypothetical protein